MCSQGVEDARGYYGAARRAEALLLSGILKCGKCRASFALSNGVRYQCSSHHDGGESACGVSLSVPRERVERIILDCVENRLLDPAQLAQAEERYRAATSSIVIDYGPKIVELERQRANLVDAITTGGLAEELGQG